MTDLATRTDTPTGVVDGEFTVGAVAPGRPVYVHNPHLATLSVSALLVLGAAGGFVWSRLHGSPHVGLAFIALLVAVGLLVVQARQFTAWDEA